MKPVQIPSFMSIGTTIIELNDEKWNLETLFFAVIMTIFGTPF